MSAVASFIGSSGANFIGSLGTSFTGSAVAVQWVYLVLLGLLLFAGSVLTCISL